MNKMTHTNQHIPFQISNIKIYHLNSTASSKPGIMYIYNPISIYTYTTKSYPVVIYIYIKLDFVYSFI